MEMFMDHKPDKKRTYSGLMVVLVLLFVLGLLLVLTSAAIGQSTANSELMKNGGSMDTTMYQFLMTNTAESYRIVGAILSIITGVGALMAGFAEYKQKKE
jgi:TctA family transporter